MKSLILCVLIIIASLAHLSLIESNGVGKEELEERHGRGRGHGQGCGHGHGRGRGRGPDCNDVDGQDDAIQLPTTQPPTTLPPTTQPPKTQPPPVKDELWCFNCGKNPGPFKYLVPDEDECPLVPCHGGTCYKRRSVDNSGYFTCKAKGEVCSPYGDVTCCTEPRCNNPYIAVPAKKK